ncbi:MAG: tetratricopeptide repeat protein [Magnetococcales bacterium]|nr:tetratricopeptide repeat protein [Magnetococcales bacterium]
MKKSQTWVVPRSLGRASLPVRRRWSAWGGATLILTFFILFPGLLQANPGSVCTSGCIKPTSATTTPAVAGEEENRMGTMFATGIGAPYDPGAAAAWYERGAKRGHALASLNLGMLYLTGEGGVEDLEQAQHWIAKAADLGNGQASHLLGMFHERGMGVAADAREAERWYLKGGEQGNLLARADWSRLANRPWPNNPSPVLLSKNEPLPNNKIPPEATPEKKLKTRGMAASPAPASRETVQPQPVTPGKTTVPTVATTAKKETSSPGNKRVSALFEKTRDAALVGDQEAQNHLGTMYLSGFGVSPNTHEALRWFQEAAKGGHPRAQINLASMILTGMGTREDAAQAATWLEQAAAQNHPEAQFLLASLFEKGKGVEKDPVKALQWYTLAAGQGQGEASKAKNKLMTTMEPEAVSKATRGMGTLLAQKNIPPPEIQLASLNLSNRDTAPTTRVSASPIPASSVASSAPASESRGQASGKRGVGNQSPVTVAAADSAPEKPSQPSALDQWQRQITAPADKKAPATAKGYTLLLTPPADKAVDDKKQQQARDELKLALTAEGNKDLPAVQQHLNKAFTLDPRNIEVAKRLGVQTVDAGQPADALPFFKAAAQAAALSGNVDEAVFANDRITEITGIQPPWVEEKLNAAGVIKPDKASVASTWTNLLDQALQHAGKGDLTQALNLGQQALDLARNNLGEEHVSTILTLREVGNLQVQNGQMDAAEPLFQQSAEKGKKILGDTHPETLAAQTLLAELKESRMQLEPAIAAYREISEQYNKGFGPNHPLKLHTDLALARVLKNQGNTTEGDRILRTTCPLVAQTFGFYHPETASCLQQFAEVQRSKGNFEAALKELTLSQSIFGVILPKQDPRTVGANITLAGIHRDLGKFADAKKVLQTVLDDIKARPNELGFLQADARTILARVHLDLGELDQAQSLTHIQYEENKAKSGPEHPNTLGSLADLAGIKEKKGLFDEAEKILNETLAGYKKIFGEKHPATITLLNNLGQLMEEAGLYDNAEPVLRQAVTLSEQVFGAQHPTTLTAKNNLALLHESQGNFDEAEPLYQQVIATTSQVMGPRHSDTVAVINNLAYLYLLKQEYDKALPLFEQVSTLWQENLGDLHQRTLKAMNNLARVHHKLGRLEQAEAMFKKTLSQRTKAMGPRHMDTLRSMHDLANVYQDMGKHKEAEDLLKETLSLDDQVLGRLHPYTFETINTLAAVLEKKSDLEGAFQVRQEGFSRRSEFLNRMLWSAGDNAREGYIRLHRPELDRYLTMLTHLDAATAGREALNVALKRKGILLKITSEIQQITQMTQDPQLEAIGKELTQSRKDLASLTLAGPAPETVDTHLQQIQGLEDKVNSLQLQLGQASKRFRHSISDVIVNQLIENLPNDAVLVDFMNFKDGNKEKMLAGLLIKNKDQAQFNLIVYPDMEAIQKAVLNYRSIIQEDEADNDELIELGQNAHSLIWRPIAQLIGARQEIYVVPDGILNILPFPALVDENEHYLTQGTDIHLLGSSRDLIPSDVPSATGQFLILAGPDYNYDQIVVASTNNVNESLRKRSASLKAGLRAFSSGMRGLRFDPLPGAEKEGTLISEISNTGKKKTQIFTKNGAQEKVLNELTQSPEVLHIATHGFFLKPDDNLRKRLLKLQRSSDIQVVPPGDNPLLRSGLAFAGINSNAQFLGEIDTENDGVLTALEVMGRDFSGTRLAVLSACETGLGEIHEGEGVYGLRRSFQEAGVQSVISSLWEVSDAGTQELMSNLYQRLQQGMNPHKALRETQLQMINSTEWKAPYIWSAFMMTGR